MNDFMKLAWIDICKTGSYLVMNTPSAAPNLTEQLKKYAASSTITDTLSDRVFGEYSGTAGLYAHQLHKLKLLLNSIYMKTQSEETTLKDYAFALRNMLMHSDYKSTIKYLEKPSTTPDNLTDYLNEIAHYHTAETLDSYTKTKYIFLYSFIKNILETNKVMSRLALATMDTYEINLELDRYFEFITQNNAVSHKLQQYTAVLTRDAVETDELTHYFATFHPENAALPLVNDTISAVALLQYLAIYSELTEDELLAADSYFKNKYHVFEQAFTSLGLNVHEMLQHVTFTTADLAHFAQQAQHDKLEKRKKQLVTQIINTAITHYLAKTTEKLNSLFQQEAPTKVAVQKAPKSVNEAPLKKELFDAKNALKQLEAEQALLKKQLKELQQKNDGLQQKLTAAQLHNTSLEQQLKQAPPQETLSPNTKELVREIAFLAQELTTELGLGEESQFEEPLEDVDEEATVETTPAPANYIEKIQHLKLAIVGGHDKYHTNIKNAFKQDVFTISPDRLNTDVSKLLNYDVLVFITSYNNHNLYNRSYDYVKKNQAKDRCLILNTQPSAKRLAQQIYEFAAQKELMY
ncbi:MAG: hypothetical protein ABS948_05055 [Solibacillus sp.]